MGDDDAVFVGGVARRLNVSNERARQLMDEGRLGPVRRGAFGYRSISRARLEAFARERERQGRVEAARR